MWGKAGGNSCVVGAIGVWLTIGKASELCDVFDDHEVGAEVLNEAAEDLQLSVLWVVERIGRVGQACPCGVMARKPLAPPIGEGFGMQDGTGQCVWGMMSRPPGKEDRH